MTENYEIPGPKHRRSRARNLLSQLWFRNVVAAVVAAVTIAAIGFLSFRAPWETYRASVTPAHTVPAGQSQVIDGQTWELGAIRHLGKWPRSFASAIPKGTEISVVTIKRSGPAPHGVLPGTNNRRHSRVAGRKLQRNPIPGWHVGYVLQTRFPTVRVRSARADTGHRRRDHGWRPDLGQAEYP